MTDLASLLGAWRSFRDGRRELARLDRQVIAQRYFSYVRIGFDQRTMEFLPDHRIGRGADRLEQRWRLSRCNGRPCLCIDGNESTICRMTPEEEGVWRGTWLLHEKTEVFLRPGGTPSSGSRAAASLSGHPMFCKSRARTPVYEVQQRYRRTVAGRSDLKQLLAVESEADAPIPFGRGAGQLCDDVLFSTLRDPATGREFWAKRYSSDCAKQLELEMGLYEALSGRDARTVLPVDFTDEHGWIFDFDPELFRGTAVHLYDAAAHFSDADASEIRAFADTVISHPSLGEASISSLTDFQVIATPHGLKFIDFTIQPRHWWML